MSKVIVGERLEKELGELTKIAEELRDVHDYVYDFLEHWEVGGNLEGDSVSLNSIMEMVADDLKGINDELQKKALKKGIVTPDRVKIAVRLAVENWFNDKLKISLEMIK